MKTIPGCCEKPFAFPPESLFTFSPGILFTFASERFSRSPRNRVHLPPESAADIVSGNHSKALRGKPLDVEQGLEAGDLTGRAVGRIIGWQAWDEADELWEGRECHGHPLRKLTASVFVRQS